MTAGALVLLPFGAHGAWQVAGRPYPMLTALGTAVLSVHPAGVPAQRLYQGRGWTTLTREFRTQPGQLLYSVMGC